MAVRDMNTLIGHKGSEFRKQAIFEGLMSG